MIYMNCPSCDAQGRIPEERVNTAIVCKKCLKTFHVKPTGHAVLGGPPVATADGGHGHARKTDHSLDVDQAIERVNAGLHKLAPIAVVLVAMVAGVGAFQWSQPTIEQRTAAMATALARGDQDAIRKLAVQGTGDAAAEWLKDLHSDVQESIQSTETTIPFVTVITTLPAPGKDQVTVRARLSPEVVVGQKAALVGAQTSSVVRATSIDVSLVLRGGAWSGWRLDGERTLEVVRRQAANRSAHVDRP